MSIEGCHRISSIDKYIVEVVVRKMLYNVNDYNRQIAVDRAMDVLKPIFSTKNNGSNIVERYIVEMLVPMKFDDVLSLLATGLSFNQIYTVIGCNRNVL